MKARRVIGISSRRRPTISVPSKSPSRAAHNLRRREARHQAAAATNIAAAKTLLTL